MAWQPVEKIEEDCDRDFFMTPEEAKDYGIIDEVLASKIRVPTPSRPELFAVVCDGGCYAPSGRAAHGPGWDVAQPGAGPARDLRRAR